MLNVLLGIPAFIKAYWRIALAVIVAAIPIISYAVGRNTGKLKQETALLKEKIQAEKNRVRFYKDFKENSDAKKDIAPRNHDDWIDRLRDGGL